jgi:hypothetical protein
LSTDKLTPAAAIFAQTGECPAAATPSPLADQKPLRQQIYHISKMTFNIPARNTFHRWARNFHGLFFR